MEVTMLVCLGCVCVLVASGVVAWVLFSLRHDCDLNNTTQEILEKRLEDFLGRVVSLEVIKDKLPSIEALVNA